MEVPFVHGFILSLGLILPLGVQNIFVFSQGVMQPSLARSLPVVITAAFSDTILILLAVGGVSLLVLSHDWVRWGLTVVGIIFLCYMGWITWSNTASEVNQLQCHSDWTVKRQVLFAMSVSLLNPHAILDTIGVIGTSSLAYSGLEKSVFTFSCVAVSWLWFLSLAAAGRCLQSMRNAEAFLPTLNRISAVIIWASAIYLSFNLMK